MKIIKTLLVLSLSILFLNIRSQDILNTTEKEECAGEWDQKKISILANLEKSKFSEQEPLNLKIRFENKSEEDIYIAMHSSFYKTFSYTIYDVETGKVVWQKDHNKIRSDNSMGSRRAALIPAGEEYICEIDLRNLYRLAGGRKYRLDLTGKFSSITSKEQTFKIKNLLFSVATDVAIDSHTGSVNFEKKILIFKKCKKEKYSNKNSDTTKTVQQVQYESMDGVLLTANLNKKLFHFQEPIEFNITLQNNSTEEICMIFPRNYTLFPFRVVNAATGKVILSKNLTTVENSAILSDCQLLPILPQDGLKVNVNLLHSYDFSPGIEYRLEFDGALYHSESGITKRSHFFEVKDLTFSVE